MSNHHFVPKFYLRSFASDSNSRNPKRIHVHNLDRNLTRLDVALSDQCYRRNFHGKDQILESSMAELESRIAPSLKYVIQSSKLPVTGTENFENLLSFVAYQMLRTPGQLNRIRNPMLLFMDDQFSEVNSPYTPEDVSKGFDELISIAISTGPLVLSHLRDLKMCLLVTDNLPFITSDNPVFRHNRIYQHLRSASFAGTSSVGLQIIVPLSPGHALFLFDSSVYQLKNNRGDHIVVLSSDVMVINGCQIVNATENIYFNCGENEVLVDELRKNWLPLKNRIPARMSKRSEVTYLHNAPNHVELDLSFLKLKKRGRGMQRKYSLLEKDIFREGLIDMSKVESRDVIVEIRRRWVSLQE